VEARLTEYPLQCQGLNYRIRANRNQITVSRLVPPREMKIPMSQLRAVELIVSSIFPPILLSLSSVIFLVGVWWFAGGGSWPVILGETYRSVCSWAMLGAVLGMTAAAYCWIFGSMKIITVVNHEDTVIRVVPRRSGERFVDALRHMMQLKEK